ncbi:MAG: hypothetical protein J6Y25_06210 [Elusimicrobiaceae bacterium]|nr:hypothetical protein [Elusimicrobiaceae bacterium]MBP5616546.1 hypothetical protein [Elusimicrobiaceae bacterium]
MSLKKRTVSQFHNEALPDQFIDGLPHDFFDHGGTLIHNARNQIKVFEMNGNPVNVKKYCIPPIINRIFYSYGIRRPKAKTTFVNAQEILKRGFLTPKPYGYIIERNGLGLITYSYFFSEQLADVKPLGYDCKDKKLITAVANFTAKLHESGLLHIDYTPNNILYREENGKYTFYLVDINRFSFRNTPWPVSKLLNNLMKPFENDDSLMFFVQEYAKARGIDGNKIIKHVLRLRHMRNRYDDFKANLKKIPGAYLFLNQPLSRKK